jgi:arylsulfatase A-like enzyme/Tfp pilus assembly protein PilF
MLFWRACTSVTLIGVLLVGACDRPPGGQREPADADPPNVLLITLDTTRADRLGCYGYPPAQTPTLDALAAAGVRFEQAFCQVPLTLPSHVSLLTGTYPPENGIRSNAGGVVREDLPTLAEAFRARGYRTGAFIGAWVLNATFGLDRGFDHYDDDVGGETDARSLYQERPGDQVCAAALAWLDGQPTQPFFAWVHFFDPHAPYAPPASFAAKLFDPYDGEIAFADAQVGHLVQWLDANHCRQHTLIVVAGDHGEAFGEHGEIEHGLFLYDVTVRVPLIFSFPECLPEGRVVAAGVRLIDVTPTILDLMGWEPIAGLPGRSLRPALETGTLAFLPAYAETEFPATGYGWASLRSYTTQRWKYLDAPRPELYDRAADPHELANVVDRHPDVAVRLREELDALLAGMTQRSAERIVLDDGSLRALQSLGYVGVPTTPEDADNNQPRRDPKDMVTVFQGFKRAQRLVDERRYAEAAQLLVPLLQESPDSNYFHALLGEAYLELREFEKAEQAYRLSLRSTSENPRKLCRLGDALAGQGRTAQAVECYDRALAASPEYTLAHSRLGMLRLEAGQFAQASEHFRRCVARDPQSALALTNLAYALGQLGRYAEAAELLQKALERRPKLRRAHRYLWQALLANGRRDAAIAALRQAREALPDDLSLTRHLARLLASDPQADQQSIQEALRLAQECCRLEPQAPENSDVLALARAAAGNFAGAIEAAQHAISLAQRQGKVNLARQIRGRLQAYQSARPQGD